MKVILLENIEKLGKKYELVDVSDGYARNFLLRKNLAQMATENNLANLERMQEKQEALKAETEKEIKAIISKLENKEFLVKMKVGEKDQLFESVNSHKISKILENEGFSISEKQIDLDEPIKELSEKEVSIKFDFNLETKIKIKIEKE